MKTSAPPAALERFVHRLALRSPLTDEERAQLLALPAPTTQVAGRTDLVSPGKTLDHACLVARGLLARFDQMRNGQRQITALHLPGDMCDLHSVVAPTAAWGITALTNSSVAYVAHDDLRDLAQRFPAIALAFWKDGTVDGSVLAKWIGNIGRQDARARLAHLLCEYGVRMELAGLGAPARFTFPASQEQLADILGLTPVHINRTLQRLRAEGVVQTRGQDYEVLDWDRLVHIAEFDPCYLLTKRPTEAPAAMRRPAPAVDNFAG